MIQIFFNRIICNASGLTLFLALILFPGCGRNHIQSSDVKADTINEVTVARLFSITRNDSVSVVRIKNPWQGAVGIDFKYLLLKRGTRIPEGVDSEEVIFVPVRKIVCLSTTHLAMISALGMENSIKGIPDKNYIYSADILRRIDNDSIKDIGYESTLNNEMILNINPDLVMMYGVGNESVGYVGKLRELGVKVIFNADYLETSPLGRAEWIKLFGALYDRQKMADSIFNAESIDYNDLKTFISKNVHNKPKVLLGLPFRDTWYISPGNSFMSRIISDAGGEYLWRNTESAFSMPFGIENVYVRALSADYWLNTGTASSLEEIAVVDPRLKKLPCFSNMKIYNNNRRISKGGGNDYWETGSLYPHVILKDISSILHPGLFDGYEPVYYTRLK